MPFGLANSLKLPPGGAPAPSGGGDRVLKFDYRGAPQTVSVITRAVLESQDHYVTRELAEMLCQGVDSKDYTSEYLAIYYGVMGLTRYMRDPRTVELVRAPHVIAAQIMRGERPSLDCDDLTALICALDLSVGGSTRAVTVAFRRMYYNGQQQYSHVFPEAQVPTGAWVVQDPVAAENTPRMLRQVVAAKIWPIA